MRYYIKWYVVLVFFHIIIYRTVSAQVPVRGIEIGLQKLTEQIIENLTSHNKRTVAVIDFANLDGRITELGKFVAEELITRLFEHSQFQITERLQSQIILQKKKMDLANIVEPEMIIQIGQQLGIEVLITGTIADLESSIKVNARLFSTYDGTLISVASAEIAKDMTIKKLLGEKMTSLGNSGYSFSERELNQLDSFFEERFNSDILSTAWTPKRGDWFSVQGMLAQNDRSVFSMIIYSGNWTGYEMQLKAKKIDGHEGFVIGIKLKDDGEALVWNIGANNNRTSVLQTYLDLTSTTSNTVRYRNFPGTEKSVYIKEGIWYDVRVVVRGPNLRCYLNDEIMINIMDPVIQKFHRGRMFLGTYLTRVYFDDIVIFGIED